MCHQKEDGGWREQGWSGKTAKKIEAKSTLATATGRPPTNLTCIRSLSLQGFDVGSPIGGGRR